MPKAEQDDHDKATGTSKNKVTQTKDKKINLAEATTTNKCKSCGSASCSKVAVARLIAAAKQTSRFAACNRLLRCSRLVARNAAKNNKLLWLLKKGRATPRKISRQRCWLLVTSRQANGKLTAAEVKQTRQMAVQRKWRAVVEGYPDV